MGSLFSVVDRELVIVDGRAGVTWHGRPLGLPVEEVQTIPGTDTAVVLLDYMAGPPGPLENLVCVDGHGAVVWHARLPSAESTDAYVSFAFDRERLVAHTWSCHRVVIDPTTGTISGAEFTK